MPDKWRTFCLLKEEVWKNIKRDKKQNLEEAEKKMIGRSK